VVRILGLPRVEEHRAHTSDSLIRFLRSGNVSSEGISDRLSCACIGSTMFDAGRLHGVHCLAARVAHLDVIVHFCTVPGAQGTRSSSKHRVTIVSTCVHLLMS
jgi:hypothetical protein